MICNFVFSNAYIAPDKPQSEVKPQNEQGGQKNFKLCFPCTHQYHGLNTMKYRGCQNGKLTINIHYTHLNVNNRVLIVIKASQVYD